MSRIMTRFGTIMTAGVAMLGSGGMAFVHPMPRLIWNATASTPIGLYALYPLGQLHSMELVAVRPPEPIARYLADGGFLPTGVPLLKHVLARPEQTVCRIGDAITIDGLEVGQAQERDHHGRPLPTWSGCRTLGRDDVFLMNPSVPDSLDGRYFGPVPIASILGRATPLFTDAASDGRFVWRAANP